MAADADDRRIYGLCLLFALAPLAVGLASRLAPPSANEVARSLDRASILLEVPCLFAVLILFLTRATWAAWLNLLLQGLLFAILVAGDAAMSSRFALRDTLAVAAVALAAWQVLLLTRARAGQAG
jgi:hypothetical protein